MYAGRYSSMIGVLVWFGLVWLMCGCVQLRWGNEYTDAGVMMGNFLILFGHSCHGVAYLAF